MPNLRALRNAGKPISTGPFAMLASSNHPLDCLKSPDCDEHAGRRYWVSSLHSGCSRQPRGNNLFCWRWDLDCCCRHCSRTCWRLCRGKTRRRARSLDWWMPCGASSGSSADAARRPIDRRRSMLRLVPAENAQGAPPRANSVPPWRRRSTRNHSSAFRLRMYAIMLAHRHARMWRRERHGQRSTRHPGSGCKLHELRK